MSGPRMLRWSKFSLCGAAAALLSACGIGAESNEAAEATGCMIAQAGGAWTNQGLPTLNQQFIVELAATPSASPIDAVVGISNGPATRFSQLAAIVRFNPSGMIDVRSGSTYQAAIPFPYTAGTTYRFRLEIDVRSHTYSVAVWDVARWRSIAGGYGFRTEQAQVAQLSNIATKVDTSAGTLQVCEVQVFPLDSSRCPILTPDNGFLHESIGQPGEVVASWTFVATPDSILDGVIGLSQSRATGLADLAAAVRFAPSGMIDVRDGDAYRADVAVPYRAAEPREIRIIADVPIQTYSVYVAGGGVPPVRLARSYRFRSPGTPTSWISELAAIVDSANGNLGVCDQVHGVSIGVRFLREGNVAIAPLPGEESLVSDGITTLRLSSTGRIQARIDSGGQIAVDPAGNIYLARISGANLVVEAFAPDLAQRWIRSYPAGDGKRVLAVGADGASVVAASGPLSGGVDLVKRWLTDGTESITRAGPMADAIAIGPAGLVLGSAINGTVSVAKWPLGPSPAPTWTRAWQNGAQIQAVAIAPDGKVYFGGAFFGPISFGGPVLEPDHHPDFADTYLAALTAAGDHVFSRHLAEREVFSIAASNGLAAVSTLARPRVFRSDGAEILGENGRNPVRGSGTRAPIAIGPSGHVYWNHEVVPVSGSEPYPYLVSFQPGV